MVGVDTKSLGHRVDGLDGDEDPAPPPPRAAKHILDEDPSPRHMANKVTLQE